ncbi:hypothetical protein ACNFJ7_01545 [Sphingomonas sp. HT-1]|nr:MULTISPECIES: hypothetical protein [unclassified Sphingomonas]
MSGSFHLAFRPASAGQSALVIAARKADGAPLPGGCGAMDD